MKKKGGSHRIGFKRPEQIIKDFRSQERTNVRMERAAKKPLPQVDPMQKIAVVIRVRGNRGSGPKVNHLLNKFGLRNINSAVFVRLSHKVLEELKMIGPFVAYGYPTLKTVHDLVTKRGFANVRGARVPLTDNKVIEKALGKKNILCTEDIVHEIFNCGENFRRVQMFLWPFKLNSARGTHKAKPTQIKVGENEMAGNHKEKINDMIAKMI